MGALEDVLKAMKQPKTGEEVRIEQAKAANTELSNPTPAIPVQAVTPDRTSHHVKDEFGGLISNIPVGHAYWNRRYRK